MPKKKREKTKKISESLAIASLIINIFIPGLGSIIGNKTREGVWQLVLYVVGIILSLIIIGIPLVIAAWIWALITGIKLIQESQK